MSLPESAWARWRRSAVRRKRNLSAIQFLVFFRTKKIYKAGKYVRKVWRIRTRPQSNQRLPRVLQWSPTFQCGPSDIIIQSGRKSQKTTYRGRLFLSHENFHEKFFFFQFFRWKMSKNSFDLSDKCFVGVGVLDILNIGNFPFLIFSSKDYKGTKVPYPFWTVLDEVAQFQAAKEDIAICTFPKCGTTWMNAIVEMISQNADPACLHDGKSLEWKNPYLELSDPAWPPEKRPVRILATQPPGRIFFTHLGYDALPKSIAENGTKVTFFHNPSCYPETL